jgi:hypothetical protein
MRIFFAHFKPKTGQMKFILFQNEVQNLH